MEQTFPSRVGELFAHDGKLAQWRGGYVLSERPAHVHQIAVSPLDADRYPKLLGQRPHTPGSGWSFQAYMGDYNYVTVDTSDWQRRDVEIAIPAPRDGREYTWSWSTHAREWVRGDFPRCGECWRYHNPSYSYCDGCGHCARKLGVSGLCPKCQKGQAA